MNLGYFLDETKIPCLKGMDTKSDCLARCQATAVWFEKSNVHLPGKMGCYFIYCNPILLTPTDR